MPCFDTILWCGDLVVTLIEKDTSIHSNRLLVQFRQIVKIQLYYNKKNTRSLRMPQSIAEQIIDAIVSYDYQQNDPAQVLGRLGRGN